METESYISRMLDTQGNVFLAESYGGEGGGDLCWFYAFPVTTTSTTTTKERIDGDRDEILQELYSRLLEEGVLMIPGIHVSSKLYKIWCNATVHFYFGTCTTAPRKMF